jgi:hypothetical protein
MGIKEWFGVKNTELPKIEEQQSCFYINEADAAMTKVANGNGFVGEVEQKKVKFPAILGEEHPFDFKQCEGIYEKFGFITAAVDKITDFIVGPGFYIECEDEGAKTIIEQFMQDVNLDTILRAWIKESLIKGNGFLEIGGSIDEGVKGLKCLDATWVYVDRDKKGVVLKYNQYKGGFDVFAKDKIIPFEPFQIAHIALNKTGDNAYGCGIVYPSLKLINNLLQNESDLHMLMNRKANSPYDISIGKVIDGKYHKPSDASIKNLGKDLEWLHNKHEWVHDAMIDIKALDFGNIGDKFSTVLEHDLEMLFYSLQIPAVLMGKANIPEGLAGVQMDAFERRIQSIQAEVEKVIETQIFKRVLNANGLDVHVEFQWGRPSAQDKLDRMLRLTELMKIPTISQSFFKLMEADLVKMLDYDENEYETMSAEEEKRRELERSQPLVPGQNAKPPQFVPKEIFEGWVTGDDGRHYYIDKDGNSHSGKDAMDAAKGEGGGDTKIISGGTTEQKTKISNVVNGLNDEYTKDLKINIVNKDKSWPDESSVGGEVMGRMDSEGANVMDIRGDVNISDNEYENLVKHEVAHRVYDKLDLKQRQEWTDFASDEANLNKFDKDIMGGTKIPVGQEWEDMDYEEYSEKSNEMFAETLARNNIKGKKVNVDANKIFDKFKIKFLK